MKLRWILLAVLCLLLATGAWVYSQLEFEERELDTGFTPVANRFHFLAATRFLVSVGMAAEERAGFSLIDRLADADSEVAANDTLILIDAFASLSSERAALLIDWAAAGGTAWISTRNFSLMRAQGLNDTLFSSFGINVWETEDHADYASEMYVRPTGPAINDDTSGTENLDDFLTRLNLFSERPWCPANFPVIDDQSGDGSTVQMQFTGNRFLGFDESGYASLADRRGRQAVFVPVGRGQLVFTTDNQMWSNRRIGCFDHAWQLIQAGTGGKTWFLVNTDADSLIDLIIAYSPAGFTLALVLIALLVWYHSRRLGPLREVDHHNRRAFMEHLESAAGFKWRNRNYKALLQPLRENVLQEAALHRPDFRRMPRNRQLEFLAGMTQIDATELNRLLFESLPDRMGIAEFEHRTRKLQMILKLI